MQDTKAFHYDPIKDNEAIEEGREVEGILKTLRLATEKTEKLIEKIENLSPSQPVPKSRVKSRAKTKPSVKKGPIRRRF